MLGSAIGKSNGVSSTHNSGTITGLSGVESSLGVVISDGILEGVGVGFIRIRGLMVGRCWFVVGRCRCVVWGRGRGVVRSSVGNYSRMVDSMVDRGMDGMVDGSMDGMVDGSMDSMVDWSMDNSRSMVGLVDGMGNDRSMSMTDDSVGADVRGGGGRGQGKEGGTHESLK